MKSHFVMVLSTISSLVLLHVITLTSLFSHVQPLCLSDESIALLQFKDSFIIRDNASGDPSAYSKFDAWTPEDKNNCCSWDGVECDETNTHVIALHLNSSCIYGSISSSNSLFRLSQLQILNLADNHFNHSQIPSQLGHLRKLTYLDLSYSAFHGPIPLEISNLSNLSYLDLSVNMISSPVPNFLAKLSTLATLNLRDCGLHGEFPNDIFHLPKLQFIDLQNNDNLSGHLPQFRSNNPVRELILRNTSFHGGITSSIGNLSFLSQLDFADCRFHGSIPSSLGRLSNLQYLNLFSNDLSGTVDFNMFLNMESLTRLILSENKLSVLMETDGNTNATVPKFEILHCASCNLTSFPDFIRYQDTLKFLDLRSNSIHGKVPKWISNTSIVVMDISYNSFIGPPPILPPSILDFDASYNEMSGEISPFFFNLSLVKGLHLSHNKLSGVLPLFLNLSTSLLGLELSHNNLSGVLPEFMCTINGSELWVTDLNHNQFIGRLPRSLANCMNLQILNLENNQFNDVFPSWLGSLPKLKVLLLRSNHFHGTNITSNISDGDQAIFPSLSIIDLSYNNFSGLLPLDYFRKWNAMKASNKKSSYMSTVSPLKILGYEIQYISPYSMNITYKGKDTEYKVIQEIFTVIDLSSNKFKGKIPGSLGNLQGLQVLNLSNNMLTGNIPSSLANITQLESLDLSQNKLSGHIPPQLVQLTFLAVFSVASNRLTGPIPQGNQFNTFENSSYEGNIRLCGSPLSQKCGLTSQEEEYYYGGGNSQGSGYSTLEFSWITMLSGFVGGLIVGVAIEHAFRIDHHEWYVKTLSFGIMIKHKLWNWKLQRTTN